MSDAPDTHVDPTPEAVEAASVRKPWVLRRIRRTLGWALLVATVAAIWLLQGSGGQRLVLDTLLGRVQSAFAGELTVQGIRSSSLLFNATLSGVRLEAEGGRSFLEADSVRIHYSAFGLITRRPTVTGITLWAPRLEISTYPGDDGPNVRRLLRARTEAGDSTAVPSELELGRIVIHDGLVEILSPAGAVGGRVPTVPLPEGDGRLKRLALEGIQGDFGEAVLRLGAVVPFSSSIRSLSMDVAILDRPLRVTDAQGLFTFGTAGIQLEDGRVSLPGSELTGRLRVGPGSTGGAWRFVTDLTTTAASLGDLDWLDDRIPDGRFGGRLQIAAGGGVDVIMHDVAADLDGSELNVDGTFTYEGGFEFDDLRVTARPLALERLEPWVGRAAPVDGWLSGQVVLNGRPTSLSTTGRVTLVPTGFGGRPTTADLSGIVHFGGDPGATNFEARLDPLNFDVLESLFPQAPVRGTGRGTVQISGRVSEGLRFTSDITHAADSLPESHVVASGLLQRDSVGAWLVDAQADLSPLALALLNDVQPALSLGGSARGTVRAVGMLRDIQLSGDFTVGGGSVLVEASADLTAIQDGYDLHVAFDGVEMTRAVPQLPANSTWSGRMEVEGRGVGLEAMEGVGSLTASGSNVGGLSVDTVRLRVSAEEGRLEVDTVFALLGGVALRGSGTVGLTDSVTGTADLTFSTDSLILLRPVFMGDNVLARDLLDEGERMILTFDGIDPDTLPLAEEVAMGGAVRGTVALSGSVQDLAVSLDASIDGGVYRRNSLGTAELTLEARGLPSRDGDWSLVFDGTDMDLARWGFQGAHVEFTGAGTQGSGWFEVRRTGEERYGATGAFALDSLGGTADLELATARVDSIQWQLTKPTRVTWDRTSLHFDDFEADRVGGDSGHVTVTGMLSRSPEEPSDFTVDMQGVNAGRVAHLLQFEETEVGGRVNFSAVVRGRASSPVIDARILAEQPMYGDISVDRLLTVVQYQDRVARVDAEAFSEDRSVFTAVGGIPVDLRLTALEDRIPAEMTMDLVIQADSLEAAGLMAPIAALQDIQGWVSGELSIRGSLREPAPSGRLNLHRAGWGVSALGVHHTDVSGLLTLYPDRTVDVAMAGRAGGVTDVTGALDFADLTNPELDLTVTFQEFQAVNRRDVTGLVSGNTTLTGTYRRPVVRGALSVDEGVLFLEEFARSAEVVDLTDPSLFSGADTLIFETRPLIADLQNPFLQNLRVDVELAVPRNTWLRSPEMNVEIGGDLILAYDRQARDLVMVGDLQALRGSYSVLGRRFEVASGTVGFIGVAGINPTLDIQAVSRIRRLGDQPLDVTANVTGSLIQPRVTLASEEQGLVESDLVSYLIFGRPTHELATGQQAALGGAVGAAASVAAGTVATAFSAAMAQGMGVDYLSISQAGDFAEFESLQGSFSATQVEIGQYLSEDVFVVVVLRPIQSQTTRASTFGGARVEWALSDFFTAEGFVEDRFLRNQSLGIRDVASSNRVLGVFVFREWGY
jgi:hypothetical protein